MAIFRVAFSHAEKRFTTPNNLTFGTILVVEDDVEIQSYMAARIRERGHRVCVATTAREAIEVAEQQRPTMILTDLQLPTLDELLGMLNSHPLLKDLTIVIIDINQPDLRGREKLQVLKDFDQLDSVVRGIEFQAP